tara:strand:+ start:497 stop:784 length:288 start_codon:yes stop_codon:yes gene_type:complete
MRLIIWDKDSDEFLCDDDGKREEFPTVKEAEEAIIKEVERITQGADFTCGVDDNNYFTGYLILDLKKDIIPVIRSKAWVEKFIDAEKEVKKEATK